MDYLIKENPELFNTTNQIASLVEGYVNTDLEKDDGWKKLQTDIGALYKQQDATVYDLSPGSTTHDHAYGYWFFPKNGSKKDSPLLLAFAGNGPVSLANMQPDIEDRPMQSIWNNTKFQKVPAVEGPGAKKIIITGHGIGGIYAQRAYEKFYQTFTGGKEIRVVTFQSPGGGFPTPITSDRGTLLVEHHFSAGDIVDLFGAGYFTNKIQIAQKTEPGFFLHCPSDPKNWQDDLLNAHTRLLPAGNKYIKFDKQQHPFDGILIRTDHGPMSIRAALEELRKETLGVPIDAIAEIFGGDLEKRWGTLSLGPVLQRLLVELILIQKDIIDKNGIPDQIPKEGIQSVIENLAAIVAQRFDDVSAAIKEEGGFTDLSAIAPPQPTFLGIEQKIFCSQNGQPKELKKTFIEKVRSNIRKKISASKVEKPDQKKIAQIRTYYDPSRTELQQIVGLDTLLMNYQSAQSIWAGDVKIQTRIDLNLKAYLHYITFNLDYYLKLPGLPDIPIPKLPGLPDIPELPKLPNISIPDLLNIHLPNIGRPDFDVPSFNFLAALELPGLSIPGVSLALSAIRLAKTIRDVTRLGGKEPRRHTPYEYNVLYTAWRCYDIELKKKLCQEILTAAKNMIVDAISIPFGGLPALIASGAGTALSIAFKLYQEIKDDKDYKEFIEKCQSLPIYRVTANQRSQLIEGDQLLLEYPTLSLKFFQFIMYIDEAISDRLLNGILTDLILQKSINTCKVTVNLKSDGLTPQEKEGSSQPYSGDQLKLIEQLKKINGDLKTEGIKRRDAHLPWNLQLAETNMMQYDKLIFQFPKGTAFQLNGSMIAKWNQQATNANYKDFFGDVGKLQISLQSTVNKGLIYPQALTSGGGNQVAVQAWDQKPISFQDQQFTDFLKFALWVKIMENEYKFVKKLKNFADSSAKSEEAAKSLSSALSTS